MKLPSALQAAIEQETNSIDLRQLIAAREELTRRYRQPSASSYMTTAAQRHAYLFSRLPATYAALAAAMQALRGVADWRLTSVLDLGAGPGTAMWAACEHFPTIEQATMIEKDSSLAGIGKRLTKQSDYPAVRSSKWLEGDLEQIKELPSCDLVILSYCIGGTQAPSFVSLNRSQLASGRKIVVNRRTGNTGGL